MLLFGYWFVMTLLPVPDSGAMGQLVLGDAPRTMAAWWDRFLLDWSRFGLGNHTWVSSLTWDPEGIFSTIPGDRHGDARQPRRPVDRREAARSSSGSTDCSPPARWE